MKKFTSILAACALAFSASAQLEGVDMTHLISNPSFEDVDAAVEGDAAHMVGWEQLGSLSGSWTAKSQKTMPAGSDGVWYARIIPSSGSIDAGNIIKQNVEGIDEDKMEGVYVLTAVVQVSRNSWRGNIDALDNVYAFMYIADGDDDPADVESRGRIKIGECCTQGEEKGAGWYEARILYYTDLADLGFEIGFGVPEDANGIPKGSIEVDNFKLTYYPTNDLEEVAAITGPTTTLVGMEGSKAGVEDIVVDNVEKDNKWYNLQGIEIAEPTRAGLYIHNGKKVVIR